MPLAAARTSTKIGPGAMAGELRAEPRVRLDEEPEVVDRPLRGPAGSASGVDERRVHGLQVAETQAARFDERFRPVDQRDVGVTKERVHLVAIIGGDDLLVAMPRRVAT